MTYERPNGPFVLTALFLITILAAVAAGCGKKAPPVAPKAMPLPAIVDLEAKVEDGAVRLSWSLPRSEGFFTGHLAGFYVQRSRVPIAEAACLDCPVVFERAADISLEFAGGQRGETYEFTHSEPVEKGYRYIYKVTAHTAAEAEGPASNLVEFIQ